MPVALSNNVHSKIALKRLGPSDYGLKLRTSDGQIVDLRVTGTYIPGGTPDSTVQNAWIWTARLNGVVLESEETLLRKRDAVDLLAKELAKRGIQEGDYKPATAVIATPGKPTAIMDKVKEEADKTHPMFRRKSTGDPSEVDPILKSTVRIKGTTLVGVVVAKTEGEQERLRIEFPEGFRTWALRDAVDEVVL